MRHHTEQTIIKSEEKSLLVARLLGVTILGVAYEAVGWFVWLSIAMTLNILIPENAAMICASVLLCLIFCGLTILLLPKWKVWLKTLPIQLGAYALAYFIIQKISEVGFIGPMMLFIEFRTGKDLLPAGALFPLFFLEIILIQLSMLGIRYLIRKYSKSKD